jgi:hypothetical protein
MRFAVADFRLTPLAKRTSSRSAWTSILIITARRTSIELKPTGEAETMRAEALATNERRFRAQYNALGKQPAIERIVTVKYQRGPANRQHSFVDALLSDIRESGERLDLAGSGR